MSEQLYFYPAGSQPATVDYYSKQQHQHQQLPVQQQPFDFDFASFGLDSSCPPVSQDLQEFENDLDSFLAQAIDVPVPFTGDPALFERFRADTPTRGVPSTFTVSSESLSAYESSLYNENESAYTYHSEASVLSDQFNMNLQTLAIDNDGSVYSLPSPMSNNSPNSNGGVNMAAYSPTAFSQRGSFSDYEPVRVRHTPASSASDYYPQQLSMKYSSPNMPTTVSPANVSSQLPNAQNQSPIVHSQQRAIKEETNLVTRSSTTKDSKRKYQCPNCPRAFARAFNLKTHVQTHDPNRLKPYACQHKSCGRAFSRKHDLTRHLISIHRGEDVSVGVASGARARCNKCGASSVGDGKVKGCVCADIK